MPPDPDQQIPLKVSRGVLVVMIVVMGVGWFGARDDRERGQIGDRSGHAFGSWTAPDIVPILDRPIESKDLELRIDAVDGFAFFLVDHVGDGRGPSTISFLNRSAKILGQIKPFDAAISTWPPTAADFPPSVNIAQVDEMTPGDADSSDQMAIVVGPSSDFQLQVQTILYNKTTVHWASPRKSSAWPLRVHIGKCDLGATTVLVSVYEMDAKTPNPDYLEGPIAALAGALGPL